MTVLEKVLGLTMAGMTVGYACSAYKMIKFIKQERQTFVELQEKAEELQKQLNETKNVIK